MKRFLTALIPLALLLAVVGCSNSPLPTNSNQTTDMPVIADFSSAKLGDPADLVSATLHLYVDIESAQRIDVHRVTADWDECAVTHNNFGGAFDAGIEGSFMADGMGWRSVEVTGLVNGWMAEMHPNFGMLLNQDVNDWPRTLFYSREGSYPPFLEVVHMDGGMMVYDTLMPTADVFIYEYYPDSNFCDKDQLWTGAATEVDMEKQALLRFEFPTTPPPQGGCSHTIGYWKTHDGSGPQADVVTPLLPIWLGDAGGTKSVFVENVYQSHAIFKAKENNNGILKLYKQLLGTKLSIADGADDADVAAAIVEADAFLANHNGGDWRGLSGGDKEYVLDLKDMFDDYNNGLIGPGHCDEMDDGGGHDDDNDDGGGCNKGDRRDHRGRRHHRR
ncbi:MAG: DNRLRE domain-containing protein [bacterium]